MILGGASALPGAASSFVGCVAAPGRLSTPDFDIFRDDFRATDHLLLRFGSDFPMVRYVGRGEPLPCRDSETKPAL
jgi:hypothetical protein